MKIGEVARRLGVTPQAIRFYEERGLLPAPDRADNDYREYGPEDFERLRLLVGLRQLDVPLDAAAPLAVLCVEGRCEDVSVGLREVIRDRRAEIARRRAELDHLDRKLQVLDENLLAGSKPEDAIALGEGERK